ncbi:Solute carrier family 35 member G2 [Oryzias melastigma]|uniref:Solute carrier family 35 member G2 n=1 Tax=Oryzias melastigma TaxID=30732 RepID=A0A834FCX3_ORYME|nr:Solute carrier family 35 member G2 [Oryzias melastigma]
MESTHLLTGSKKRVKIHPHTVTAKYATQAPYTPQAGVHTHFPQPGDDGYDDAPSFEDFGSFLEETSDKKKLMESRRWPLTLFGSKEKDKEMPHKLQPTGGAESDWGWESRKGSWERGRGAAGQFWGGVCVCVPAHLGTAALRGTGTRLFDLRSVVQLLSVAVPLLRGENPFGPEGYRLRLFCYGVAYSLSLCCAYSSLTFVSAGNATTTWRLATTALSAVLAFLLLEERLGLSDVITIAAGLCGLGLLLLPTTDEGNSDAPTNPVTFWKGAFGWSLSALAGLWMALALVGYRSLKDRVGIGTALFTVSWTSCLLAPSTLAFLQDGWAWPVSVPAWAIMAGLVSCSAAAFLGMTHALTRLHPALVSASQSVEVPVAMLLHLAVLPVAPTCTRGCGECHGRPERGMARGHEAASVSRWWLAPERGI